MMDNENHRGKLKVTSITITNELKRERERKERESTRESPLQEFP